MTLALHVHVMMDLKVMESSVQTLMSVLAAIIVTLMHRAITPLVVSHAHVMTDCLEMEHSVLCVLIMMQGSLVMAIYQEQVVLRYVLTVHITLYVVVCGIHSMRLLFADN
jgi:hypothetical protein